MNYEIYPITDNGMEIFVGIVFNCEKTEILFEPMTGFSREVLLKNMIIKFDKEVKNTTNVKTLSYEDPENPKFVEEEEMEFELEVV